MTADEWGQLIVSGKFDEVAAAAAGLTEAERRALSKTTAKLATTIRRNSWQDSLKPAVEETHPTLAPHLNLRDRDVVCTAVEIAVLSVCPLGDAKKVRMHTLRNDTHAALVKVLTDRRPEWIDDFVDHHLSPRNEWQTFEWAPLRELIRNGVCAKPTSDGYVRLYAMNMGAWYYHTDQYVPISEQLAAEPDLLDDVWRLFEVENFAFSAPMEVTSSNTPSQYESWHTSIAKLSARGLLDRQRLLDESIAALQRGFKNNALSGYARLHDHLQPTLDELAARQPAYLDLLTARVGQVVNFGINTLKKLDQAKRLDDAGFIAGAGRAFDLPAKGPAKTAIGLFKKIGKRSPQLTPTATRALLHSALIHPDADCAAAAAQLLVEWRAQLDEKTIAAINERLPELPATVQALLQPLVVAANNGISPSLAGAAVTPDDAEIATAVAELRQQADALPERWRTLVGVDDALAAVDEDRWPAAIDFVWTDVPILTGVELLPRVESADELLDLVARAVEQVESGDDIERILDGIARLGAQKPPDCERRANPILQRIAERPQFNGHSITDITCTPKGFIAAVIWWLGGDDLLASFRRDWERINYSSNIVDFLSRRCEETLARLRAGHFGPMLSTPTHAGGWIDPLAFAARWRYWLANPAARLDLDLVLALHRMAPDHRPAALAELANVEHPSIAAIRWALGDRSTPPRIAPEAAELWVAAANARGQDSAFTAIADAGVLLQGPNVSGRAHYAWTISWHEWKSFSGDETFRLPQIKFTRSPALAGSPGDDCLAALLHSFQDRYWRPSMIEHLASLQPSDGSGLLSAGIERLIGRIDDPSSSFEPNHPFLQSLIQVDRPLDELAYLALVTGFMGKDADSAAVARDALIDAVDDGRADGQAFGALLSQLTLADWLKLNRISANLAEVARNSPLHAATVAQAIDALIAAYAAFALPRDFHHLLTVQLELLMQLGLRPTEAACASLRKATGSSKTGKLSARMLALEHRPTAALAEAKQRLVESRLLRATRWAAGASSGL
ncbi:DUF6493 family protein [Lacipirellula parvula]|uniref:Uncharacterized protein n=1 Tax=Lacipirellula parvula TaxID=2650471 RepID=A0A5K7X733_9BACT|nr:DUF6493 family protein [Lacipirellula parvula]BBO32544.1 hypothetical protein PLANPX_2156 [Lacipirellula parvula]